MTDKIGPTFGTELQAAGFADGVAWNAATGELLFNSHVEIDEKTGTTTTVVDTPQATVEGARAVLTAHDPTKILPDPVPDNASRLGLMRALREIGKWDAAKQAIASNAEAQEEWDLAISIKRDDPLTAGIIQALGLAPADVDHLLVRAAALTG